MNLELFKTLDVFYDVLKLNFKLFFIILLLSCSLVSKLIFLSNFQQFFPWNVVDRNYFSYNNDNIVYDHQL